MSYNFLRTELFPKQYHSCKVVGITALFFPNLKSPIDRGGEIANDSSVTISDYVFTEFSANIFQRLQTVVETFFRNLIVMCKTFTVCICLRKILDQNNCSTKISP